MKTAKETQTALAQQLIAGAKKHFSTVSSLTFGNATVTPAQIEASLQTLVDLQTAVDDARTATKAKVVAEETQGAPLRSQMAAFAAFVKVTFGQSPDILADFGLKPKKAATPLTAQQKVAAAAKRQATRAARHTMGTKQKKDVKGTITTIVSTPTSPASPATPAAPAPAPAPIAPSPVVSAPTQGTSAGAAPHVA